MTHHTDSTKHLHSHVPIHLLVHGSAARALVRLLVLPGEGAVPRDSKAVPPVPYKSVRPVFISIPFCKILFPFVTFFKETPNCTMNAIVITTSPLQAASLVNSTIPTVCPVLRSNIADIILTFWCCAVPPGHRQVGAGSSCWGAIKVECSAQQFSRHTFKIEVQKNSVGTKNINWPSVLFFLPMFDCI